MEDRYLFRAKRIDNGEWVEGFYAMIGKKHVIISKESEDYYTESIEKRHGNEIANVDPSTICQCTGLKDENGKMIFEHDIVNCIEAGCYGEIIWNESEAGFYLNAIYEDGTFGEERIYDYIDCSMVVTGNIFDE